MGWLSIGTNPNPLTLTYPPKIGDLKTPPYALWIDSHISCKCTTIFSAFTLRLPAKKIVQHTSGLCPTICELLLSSFHVGRSFRFRLNIECPFNSSYAIDNCHSRRCGFVEWQQLKSWNVLHINTQQSFLYKHSRAVWRGDKDAFRRQRHQSILKTLWQ